MSELHAIARLKIHHGKLEEFKRLAVKCMESVRTRDSGTLQLVLQRRPTAIPRLWSSMARISEIRSPHCFTPARSRAEPLACQP